MTTQTAADSSVKDHLSQALTSTTSAFEVSKNTAAKIIGMPNLSNPVIPTLSSDIQETKKHAQLFNTQITPEIHKTFGNMTSFVTQFNSSYSKLQTALTQWTSSGKPSTDLETALHDLSGLVASSSSDIQTLSTTLNNFRQNGADTSRKLTADASKANAQINADKQQEAALQGTINSLNSKIAAARARNSVFHWFGPLGWLVSEISDLVTNEKGVENQYHKVINERATIENEAGQLNCLLPQLNVFIQSTQLLLSGVLSINQAWNVLQNDFQEITQALASTEKTPPAFIKAHLDYIHSDFSTLLAQLQKLSK
jgi:chromosome segregation ATPase